MSWIYETYQQISPTYVGLGAFLGGVAVAVYFSFRNRGSSSKSDGLENRVDE